MFILQNSSFAQNDLKITIKKKNITLLEAFQQIEKQSTYLVAFNESKLEKSKQIDLDINAQPLDKSLAEILKGTGHKYKIKGNYIMIVPEDRGTEEKKTLTGVVTDEKGEPLIGVNVLVKGHSTGTVTNIEGQFTLQAAKGEVIEFSYIGYATKSVTVGNAVKLAVVLSEDSKTLDEVVVTALGIKRSEKALSYNVQKIDNEGLTVAKDANFMNSLNGKVAGVNIQKSSSGVGGATRVVMRGSKSIVGNNNALYVVDGMPIGNSSRGVITNDYGAVGGSEGISDFNPDDIESISVLTGPSAAALYGAAAANGVILINTKKGKEGKMKLNFSTSNEFMNPSVSPEFQTTYGNKKNSYRSWGDKLETPSTFDPMDFFKTGFSTINSLNISTGTKSNQTFISVASTNSKGIIPNNEYYRYNFSFRNTALMLNDKLHLDMGVSYVLQGEQNMITGGRYFNPLFPLYLFPRGEDFEKVKIFETYNEERRFPTQEWEYGDQGLSFENPYWIINREMFPKKRKRYMLHARAQYDIFDWLNIAGRVRIDNTHANDKRKLSASTLLLYTNSDKGSYLNREEFYDQTYADVMMNINKSFKHDFSLTANLGTSFEDHYTRGIEIDGKLATVPNLFSAANLSSDSSPKETYKRTRNIAVFASAELGWKNMLYLTATGRTDWASQLVSNGKTPGIFYPSVGLSAIITEMASLPQFISYLKVRGSYTEVGSPISQVGITPGSITDSMTAGIINPISTYPYPDFRPERTKSYELGINARFWDGRITFDGTFYQSNTYNQTFLSSMSAASGYSGFYIQAGNVRNRGVEMALGYNDKYGDWGYSTNLTYTANRNKILEMVHDYRNPIDNSTVNIVELNLAEAGDVYVREGYSMSDIFVTGILQRGRDGRLIEEGSGYKVDRSSRIRVGSADPDFTLGWRHDVSFKQFSLGVLLTGRFGGVVLSQTQAFMDAFGVSKASADARDNGGVVFDGNIYDAERFYTTIGGQTLMGYYTYDATNIRLQELSFTYSLPKKWLKGIFDYANLSFVGRNLLLFYRAAPFDPEVTSSTGTYSRSDFFMMPNQRSLGFSIKFGL
ncbi:SusC/RagA family TonB-linked outer membrane protein [Bacteroides caecimuris]|uniref:SusC/RagA family TonB-linked outer membrane protein n=1 Tax=Bacteroides caecimuris TaxID=1796613 RepID=UPI00325AE5D9